MPARYAFLVFTCLCRLLYAGQAEPLLKKGWAALAKDNDTTAIMCFELAYETALKEKDTTDMAAALLNLGICYYGVSQTKGLEYCSLAMDLYRRLEHSQPRAALKGRCRCLQLLATIYGRQGKYRQVIALSHEAKSGFYENDSAGYLGLTYNSLGSAYHNLNQPDSSEFYYRKAVQAHLEAGNLLYLPGALVKLGDVELRKKQAAPSLQLYRRALHMADSSGNRQALVSALNGLGKWQTAFGSADSAELFYQNARQVARQLADRTFYLHTLEQLLELRRHRGQFREALDYHDEIARVKDSISSYDKQKLAKSLEVQFHVAEKDRKLLLLQKEKDIALLANYLLWASIGFLIILSAGIIFFLRRSHARDKLLLQTKEALVKALEEQKQIRERYLQNEIEFKESQLSTLALQILQRNELMQELKLRLDENKQLQEDPVFAKIINKGLNHDEDWRDFNTYFESINQNFYARLKQAYPDISPNDLRLCALIKLNLSSKEMAGILNISPDSVKTARYRLRKKLALNTEDNLADFILRL